MEILTNNTLEIGVKTHGAELASIRHNCREYLWQANKAFWQRHSPVLFPIVGSVWDGEYRIDGTTYKMGQHGFARDMDFKLVSRSEDEIWYELTSTEESLKKYPYDFKLSIGYKLIDNRVRVMWRVENTGSQALPFQIGAHPAFFWPLLSDKAIEAGVEAMNGELAATDSRGYFKISAKNTSRRAGFQPAQTHESTTLTKSIITEGGCVGDTGTTELDAEGYLPLTIDTFDHDALIFEDYLVDKVTICREDKSPYLSLEFTSPLVGLWSPPKKRAPFVCIEPWYGRCDRAHYTGDFKDKQWMQTLAPGQTFNASYDIIVH